MVDSTSRQKVFAKQNWKFVLKKVYNLFTKPDRTTIFKGKDFLIAQILLIIQLDNFRQD